MKKLFFLLCAILFAVSAQAQTAQVATLSHEGKITTYYSGNALKDAVNAAVDGDIITLSSGTFSSPSKIEKNLTIRGAGMMPDENPTVLTGDLLFECPQGDNVSMTLEGFYHNGKCSFRKTQNAKLVKVWISDCDFYTATTTNKNVSVLHSIIGKLSQLYQKRTDISFQNSVILSHDYYMDPGSIVLSNCVIFGDYPQNYSNTEFKNCIIIGKSSNRDGNESSTYTHCYYFGAASNPFKYSISNTNVVNNSITSAEDVFEETVTYTLSEDRQKEWLGNDGTQVGIHGSMMPFDPTPTNPQITKFNVAPKTTADGKLSVDIEVQAN